MLVQIPMRLVSEANSSEHYTVKSKRHRQQKFLVFSHLFHHPIPNLPISVTLTRHSPRTLDSDNLQFAFKYVRDAVSEHVTGCKVAGRADNDERIKWTYEQKKISKESPFITIEIKEIDY